MNRAVWHTASKRSIQSWSADWGRIVNTASTAGLITSPGQASYTATKHTLVAISKTLRVQAERHGVQVSVLCPGVIFKVLLPHTEPDRGALQ